ncbi:hypothetical protein FQR65_LT03742 [Abscondita terminalis]|nr:hypothetical protein FQR65_LT03742 [Abscondita terminalis]
MKNDVLIKDVIRYLTNAKAVWQREKKPIYKLLQFADVESTRVLRILPYLTGQEIPHRNDSSLKP